MSDLYGVIDTPITLTGTLEPKTLEITAQIIGSGPQGPKGDKGESGDLNYVHNQLVPSDEWICEHGLGKRTSVTIRDSSGNVVEGDIQTVDINTDILRFAAPFAGIASFN